MDKFKVGDRVINISDKTVPIGDRGIVMFTPINGFIGVAWDSFDKGHDFEEQKKPFPYEMKPRHGWYVFPNDIEPSGELISIDKLKWLNRYNPINIKIDTPCNRDIEKFAKQVDELCRGKGIGFTFINGNTFEVKKEKESMLNLEFKTEEGYRIDKTCNKQIPTIKTTVSSRTYPLRNGVATCDKTDYSERQGVIEALANLICNGNFDREFNKAVKKNKLVELHDRTCIYCGKVFDTVEELRAHEAWHVERKKARRERYLLRKRAKEIAFEEQAQKMAKDMLKEKPNE